jgi:hypothetical protein
MDAPGYEDEKDAVRTRRWTLPAAKGSKCGNGKAQAGSAAGLPRH